MKTHIQILKEISDKREKYFKNYLSYAKKIKKTAEKFLKDVKVYIFGSVVKNKYTPTSDIDILIVSSNLPKNWEQRRTLRTKIKSKFPFSPFEIHLVTEEEFNSWYKKFLKKDYKEIK